MTAWRPKPYWQRFGLWALMFAGVVGGVLGALHLAITTWQLKPPPPPRGGQRAELEDQAQDEPEAAAR